MVKGFFQCVRRLAWPTVLLLSGQIGNTLALDLHGIPAQNIGLWAASVETGEVIEAWRADEPMSPASTMKLVTTWTALQTLGPHYVWRTEFVSAAPVENGVLKGDLYWVGRGDPAFRLDHLRGMLMHLKARGIQTIQGRLLLDKTAFNRITTAEGFDHDKGRAFMCPPDTHLVQTNTAWLRFFNDTAGPRVVLDPPFVGVHLDTQLKRAEYGTCDNVRDHVTVVQQNTNKIALVGQLPASCDGVTLRVEELMPPARFAVEAFRTLWQEMGGNGPEEGMGEAPAPNSARVLAFSESAPLSRSLPDMIKYSNNPMTRLLYLSLGYTRPSRGDSVAEAEITVRRTLGMHGIEDKALVLENGSGLSRRERLSARLLGEMLIDAARGPYAVEFIHSLPTATGEGTLQDRFMSLGPRLRLKTGSLNGVRALAGFWHNPDGRRLAIVAMLNQSDAAHRVDALDAIVRDIIQRYIEMTSTRKGEERCP